jgi:hypothetical protein
MIDFTELRNRILSGEDEESLEAEPSDVQKEAMHDTVTLTSLVVGGFIMGLYAVDKAKFDGQILSSGDNDYSGIIFSLFGILPFAYGVGRITRGLEATKQAERYERLVGEAETLVEEMESELDEKDAEMEQKAAEEQAQDSYHFDFLSESLSKDHRPSIGALPFSPVGQEGIIYRRQEPSIW